MLDKKVHHKIYYPSCNITGCDGVLKFKINDNFRINYECDKNINHKRKNICIKTFERFNLKQKVIQRCAKCKMFLENDIKYECNKCKNCYCGLCFMNDAHIKHNLNNLIITNNKCKIHKKELILYCLNCKKNLCLLCINEDENKIHEKHNIEYLNDIIPSINDINEYKDEIIKTKEIYEQYILLINEWLIKLNSKMKEYIKYLRDKILLIEKLFFNFNKDFNNYTYYKNFNYFSIRDDYDLEKAKELINSNNFENFKDIIVDLMETKIKRIKIKEPEFEFDMVESLNNKDDIFYQLKNNYFFINSKDKIYLAFFDENNNLKKLDNSIIDFEYEINSVSLSLDNKRIYICLKDQKIIKILNCDLINGIMEIDKNEINDENINNNNNDDDEEEELEEVGCFLKCIELPNGLLAASEDIKESISIWDKNKFSKVRTIQLENEANNLILINSNYFISSHYDKEKIIFYNINNLEEKKEIKKISIKDESDCNFSFNNNYLIVNCTNGLAILSIKNQELIQFYEYADNIKECSCVKIDEKDNFYYLYYYKHFDSSITVNLNIGKIKGDSIITSKKYTKKYEDRKNNNPSFEIFLCKDNIFIKKNEDILIVNEQNLVNEKDFYSDLDSDLE